jgi:chemotaxis protein methyltransferase CheR
MHPFLSWLLAWAGLRADAYRPASLQRRLNALLRCLRVPTPEAARTLLEANPSLLPHALDTLLVGVTDFFRDSPVFEYLQRPGIPELLRTRAGLRVLSAGVSDGRELYSVAMLVAEAGELAGSEFVGMDCRPSAIASASQGLFDAPSLARIPDSWWQRYLAVEEGGWRARDFLRQQMQWRRADLLSLSLEPSRFDLILFRNVAIYLRDREMHASWETLCAGLSKGGLLVTGKAERPPSYLPVTRLSGSIYQKL